MRIVIVGAHGVGKSTLSRALAERLKLPLIPEYAQSVLDRKLLIDDWRTCSDEGWLLWQELLFAERIVRILEAPCAYIMDRCLIDVAAYIRVGATHRDLWDVAYTLHNRALVWGERHEADVCLFYRWPGHASPPDGREFDVAINWERCRVAPGCRVIELLGGEELEEIVERIKHEVVPALL